MSMDWIKMRIDLQSHPKIVRILSAMNRTDVQTITDKFRVIGGLHAVWSVFDTHSEDGKLNGYTPELMDHIIGWQGFSRAMESVGWLIYDGIETLSMPDFTEHNGQSGKRRAEDQKRKRDARKLSAICPQESGQNEDRLQTREEKRREDIKTLTSSGKPDDVCPHQEILKLYEANLPELPQPRIWDGARAKNLASRWKWVLTAKRPDGTRYAETKDQALTFFDRFFHYVASSDFLMGRGGSWSCDLGWLVKAENFAKVVNGNYDNREAA